ncbi:PIN domain-like protein [Lyophyllum atratum]|nr:PIN domain-like protein [Lyophyllum atratum]
MGINALWPLLRPVAQATTLQRLAVNDGFLGNASGARGLRIGIDASAWIFRACYRHSKTKNPELATLFTRCCRLLQLPILPLFVFDGPARPKTKRGKAVRGNPHWLTAGMKEMLDVLAFPWIDAPGEAEAELAWLSKVDHLDAILTEDSDAVVFGASTILRVTTEAGGQETIRMYRASDISNHAALRLNTADLVLIALLAGGDYAAGVQGCGVKTAVALAHAGLGRRLIAGIQEAERAATAPFLAGWRLAIVEELRTNASGHLKQRLPHVADAVPLDFPDIAIVNLYLHPTTSEYADPSELPSLVQGHGLDLARLVRFAETHFLWGDPARIYRTLATKIFPGLAMRQLIGAALSTDLGLQPKACPMIGTVVSIRRESESSEPHVPEVRMNLHISDQIINTIFDVRRTGAALDKHSLPRCRAWLPVAVIEHVKPEVLAEYLHRTGGADAHLAKAAPHVVQQPEDVIDLTADLQGPMPALLPAFNKEIIDLTLSDDESVFPSQPLPDILELH